MIQDYFTILNNNEKSNLENQMVSKGLENIKVPNNSEMGSCKLIFLNMYGHNVVNAVVYLSGQVTAIIPNCCGWCTLEVV